MKNLWKYVGSKHTHTYQISGVPTREIDSADHNIQFYFGGHFQDPFF